MKEFKKILKVFSILMVVGLMLLPVDFAFASGADRPLTDRENAAFIVRDEWTAWVKGFTASLSELDKNATSRIYDNMDFYDMQYRFTEKYKKVPEYLDEDGKPTQKLKDLIKKKRKEISGAKAIDYLCFTSRENGSKVSYTKSGTVDIDMGISYDGVSFTPWTGSEVTLDSGKSIYILNKKDRLSISGASVRFGVTGNVEVSGDISSLVNFKNISEYSFAELFRGCDGLTSAKDLVLSATSVPSNAYAGMFLEATKLVDGPQILATTLGEEACHLMFYGCEKLSNIPMLNFTSVGNSACLAMFSGCEQLSSVPTILPATRLSQSSYSRMFEGCTSLVKAPHIAATTIAASSCNKMFDGCTSLNEIALDNYTGDLGTTSFNNWVNNVAASGILYYKGSDTTIGASNIPTGWIVLNDDLDFLKFTAEASSTVRWSRNGAPTVNIYYSKNGGSWESWAVNTDIPLDNGDNIRVWNANSSLSSANTKFVYFAMTGSIAASGNCNSMQNFSVSHNAYTFYRLFDGCSALTSAPDIPGNANGIYCYAFMFRYTSISKIVLPSTNVPDEGYRGMFNGCSNLSEITIGYTGSFNYWQFEEWVSGVASIGSFYYDGTDTTRGSGAIPNGWVVKSPLTFKSTAAGSKIKYVLNGGLARNNIVYRKNNGDWTPWANNTEVTLDNNDTLKVWNKDSTLSSSSSSYLNFVITGSVEADKNIESLLNYSNSLSQYCYYRLFNGCTGLTKAPTLAATTLATACYQGMFSGCTALTAAPTLPATTLANSCYQDMFNGCTSLTSAPALSVTALANSCYQGMFSGCTGLTTAPELPATTLVANCYNSIFNGCSNLNFINIGYSGVITTSYFSNWVNGVADTGSILYAGSTNTFGPSALPKDDSNKWNILSPLTFTSKANNTEIYYILNGLTKDNIYYKLNGGAWTKWEPDEANKITLANGQTLSVWNRDNTLSSDTQRFEFKTPQGSLEASGDIQSMINYSALHDYCFSGMFYDCIALIKSPTLSATTLADSCYAYMFNGCTNLTEAPHLPATTLVQNCYKNMFDGCTNLSKMSTDYTGAFGTTYFANWVDGVSPSGTFKYLGTSASYGVNAIPSGWLIIPSGDSFTLTSKQANSSVSYKYLDRDLNETNPGTEYAKLYYSKNGGDWIKWNKNTSIQLDNNDVLEVRNASNTLTYWGGSSYVVGVTFAMSGNIEASGEITALMNYQPIYASCFKALFYNCSALTKAPELPSGMADACYYEMFKNCTSLEKAPRLRATTLANSCYHFMFAGCTSLNEIKIDYTGALSDYTSYWVQGVNGEGTFYYNGPTTSHGQDAIPTYFTVQTFTP